MKMEISLMPWDELYFCFKKGKVECSISLPIDVKIAKKLSELSVLKKFDLTFRNNRFFKFGKMKKLYYLEIGNKFGSLSLKLSEKQLENLLKDIKNNCVFYLKHKGGENYELLEKEKV